MAATFIARRIYQELDDSLSRRHPSGKLMSR